MTKQAKEFQWDFNDDKYTNTKYGKRYYKKDIKNCPKRKPFQ